MDPNSSARLARVMNAGYFTRQEIFSQPEAWAGALDVLRARSAELRGVCAAGMVEQLLITGCGSTYYLALAAAALAQEQLGLPSRGLPASEIWLYPRSVLANPSRSLLVAISRSGETTETIQACRAFRAAGGRLLTLTGYPASTLATLGQANLVLPTVQEQSIAQTRAFSSLYLAVVALIALWTGRSELMDELVSLPLICRRLLSDYAGLAADLGRQMQLDRFYFLGSGPRYGLACELALKMKEMSLSHSEPFHFYEFRHGPQSMIAETALVVGLVSEVHHADELGVLSEMRTRGARVLSIGDREAQIAFGSGTSEAARGALYLLFGQLLAYERALAKGLNPDQPHNLSAVVRLG